MICHERERARIFKNISSLEWEESRRERERERERQRETDRQTDSPVGALVSLFMDESLWRSVPGNPFWKQSFEPHLSFM